jgi:hypothetical protein
MRYRLRTLLILLAIGLFILAMVCFAYQFDRDFQRYYFPAAK